MKTRYKYIHFVTLENSSRAYECRNNRSKSLLGWVSHYKPWKQFVFTAERDWPIFNDSCLADIQHFMSQLEKPSD